MFLETIRKLIVLILGFLEVFPLFSLERIYVFPKFVPETETKDTETKLVINNLKIYDYEEI